MHKLPQLKLSSALALTVLVSACSLWTTAAFGEESLTAALPTGALAAKSQTLSIGEARDLLDVNYNAADLKYRPPLWDWTQPATRQMGQATPPVQEPTTTTPQTPAQPSSVPTEEPASQTTAPDNVGDVLDEVSVTATRRATRQRDTTAVTYTVKKEDFAAQGAATVTDALQLVPGFIAQPALGGVRNAAGVFLRGFDDNRFQVLRDGLSLTRSSNSRNDVSRFAIEDLERIEIVTGGATLRYGSGAVGGVINLITETPKGPPKVTIRYETGTYGFTRYTGKYGGGDDAFSYNLFYTSISAFNDYPYSFTLPNSPVFYGTSTNPDSISPAGDGTNNSFGVGGVPGDPENNGPTDLFGYLKPDRVGPPITASGRADSAFAFSDTYSAKLTFKPDAVNRVTLRLNQQNSKNAQNGPGAYGFGVCFGGPTGAANGTFNFDRNVPVDRNGVEQPCNIQPFTFNSPTASIFGTGGTFPYTYNASLNGAFTYPTGQAYRTEGVIGTIDSFSSTLQHQTEAALFHDLDLSPTTSLNSYIALFRFAGGAERPSPFLFNSNIEAVQGVPGDAGQRRLGALAQPYFEGIKLEAQTAINSQISAGQSISFGVNFTQDRSYQQKSGGQTFFDQAISRTSVFLIDDISFGPQFKANLGGRYTYSTQFGSVGTPAVGVRFSPNNLFSLRANYSYVFRAPDISSLYVSGAPFVANTALGPESGVTWDAGVDFTPVRNVSLQATYFNTYLDGALGNAFFGNPDVNNPNSPFFGFAVLQQIQNLDSRFAAGIEAAANWQITDEVSLRAVWTNTDARQYGPRDDIQQGTYPFFYEYQDPNIPFNNVLLNAVYRNKGGLLVSLLGRYDSGKRRFASTDFVPAWATLDLNVEIPITRNFILTGNVFNVTDTQYEFVSGVPAPGLTYRVGGRLEFGGAEPEAQ